MPDEQQDDGEVIDFYEFTGNKREDDQNKISDNKIDLKPQKSEGQETS